MLTPKPAPSPLPTAEMRSPRSSTPAGRRCIAEDPDGQPLTLLDREDGLGSADDQRVKERRTLAVGYERQVSGSGLGVAGSPYLGGVQRHRGQSDARGRAHAPGRVCSSQVDAGRPGYLPLTLGFPEFWPGEVDHSSIRDDPLPVGAAVPDARGLRTAGGLVSKHSMMPVAVWQRVHLRVKSPVPRLFEQQRLPLAVWFGDELHLASPLDHRRGRVDPARLDFTPGAVQDMRSASNG